MGSTRCGLKATRAPAAVDIQSGHWRCAKDRGTIRRYIDNAAPFAQHPHTVKDRENLADRRNRMLDQRQATTLRITGVLVCARPNHKLALVRLADIGMHGVGHDNTRENRFYRFGHQCLERIAFKRHTDTGRIHHNAGVAGCRYRDFFRTDKALGCFNAFDRTVGAAADRGDRAVLNDINTTLGCTSGIAPGNRIMTCSSGTHLKRTAHDGVACIRRNVQRRAEFFGFVWCQPAVINTIEAVRMNVTLERLHIMNIVRQHQNATA